MVRLLTRPFSEHSVGKGRFAVAREICGDDRELVRELWGSLPPGQTRFGVSGQEQHDRPGAGSTDEDTTGLDIDDLAREGIEGHAADVHDHRRSTFG
jgi:hypothetical protein